MTDRYSAFLVILEEDLRDDDAQPVIDAIKQIRGVLDVKPHVGTFDEAIAQTRVRSELGKKLWNVLYSKK